MTEVRLEAFVRGVAFREPNLPIDGIVGILRAAVEASGLSWTDDELKDRALVKLAALSVAFWREAGNVIAGKFELDHRDEAVLDAVVEHLSRST